jgi:transposase
MMTWIGADVGKASVTLFANGVLEQIPNEFPRLKARFSKFAGECSLVVEGAGGYSRATVQAALACGMTVYPVNPADFKHYRDSLSYRTKTDPIDAELLARYGEKEHDRLRVYQPPSPEAEHARSLLGLREQLIKARSSISLNYSELPDRSRRAESWVMEDIAHLSGRIRAIEEELAVHVQARPMAQALLKVRGIGLLLAAALDWIFDKGVFESSDQLVAMVGLDIRLRQSGKHRGLEKLTKRGDPLVRKLLTESANALRRSKAWKPLFQRYESRGLSKTATNVIVARKILRIAFAVLVKGEDYDESKVGGLDHSLSVPKRLVLLPYRPILPACVRKFSTPSMRKTRRKHSLQT